MTGKRGYYPPEPLLQIAERRSLDPNAPVKGAANILGTTRRNIHRWRSGGTIAPRVADECACRLGLHLDLIWPDGPIVTGNEVLA